MVGGEDLGALAVFVVVGCVNPPRAALAHGKRQCTAALTSCGNKVWDKANSPDFRDIVATCLYARTALSWSGGGYAEIVVGL
jgi:hypothetical protein